MAWAWGLTLSHEVGLTILEMRDRRREVDPQWSSRRLAAGD